MERVLRSCCEAGKFSFICKLGGNAHMQTVRLSCSNICPLSLWKLRVCAYKPLI